MSKRTLDIIEYTIALVNEFAKRFGLSEVDSFRYIDRYNGFYPSPWLMEEACKMGVPAVISADAHHFSEVTLEFAAAVEALKKAGYRSVVNFKDGQWIEVVL